MRNHWRPLVVVITALLWAALVLVGYYYVHKPIDPAQAAALLRAAFDLALAVAVSGLAGGVGRRLLPAKDFSPLERFALQAALGWGIFGLLWFGRGLAQYDPTGAILGTRSAEEYLDGALGWYGRAMRALADLPQGSRTLFLWDERGLYAEATKDRIPCELPNMSGFLCWD